MSGRVQADGYARIAHHACHDIDVVLVGKAIDIGFVVAVRYRHRSAPDRVVDLRDARQLSVGAADRHRFAGDDPRGGAVIGMDEDFGGFTEEIELRIQLLALPTRHHDQRRRWLEGGKLIEEQLRRQPPAAHPRDVLIHPRRR